MTYLALDYGQVHIGVALAEGSLAEPLTTIPTNQASKLLPGIIDKYQVNEIIIGRPDESLKLEFENFLMSLKNFHPERTRPEQGRRSRRVKFQIVDETLSSHDAREALLHTTQTRRKMGEHVAAAAVILQSWLDSHSPPLD